MLMKMRVHLQNLIQTAVQHETLTTTQLQITRASNVASNNAPQALTAAVTCREWCYVPAMWKRRGLHIVIHTCVARIGLFWIACMGFFGLSSRSESWPFAVCSSRHPPQPCLSRNGAASTLPRAPLWRRAPGTTSGASRCARYVCKRVLVQSCPGLNSRDDGTTLPRCFRRLFLMLIFLQSNILPVIGVRVDSVPTALSGAQSGPQQLLRQANTVVPGCVKPSGSLDFSGH